MTDALVKPFYQIVTTPPRQWHPVLVHFPIAFLIGEAVLLGLWRITGKTDYERWAYAFLHVSLWTILPVALAGLHDTGLDAGAGNPIWLGLQDRWANAFRWHSSVTVHTWLAWRKLAGPATLQGVSGLTYALLTLLSLWLLNAAGYVGGMISHR